MTTEQEIIDNLLDQWEELQATGHFVTPWELCKDKPSLLAEIKERISAIEWVKRKQLAFFGDQSPGGAHFDSFISKRSIGRFDLIEVLGAGNFGAVWRAYDNELRRDVAIKLPRQILQSEHQRDLFIREARNLASLEHPNIVGIHDIGREGDEVFIVSKLVEGQNLAEYCANETPGLKRSIEIIRSLSKTLDFAHQHGIIHRDIKPANILIAKDGSILLADFGIAISEKKNETRSICGTPAYQSPEQSLVGDTIDRRSDIFSLAVVAYQLLTGKLPFQAGQQAVFNRPTIPPPNQINPAIPRHVSDAVMKSLAALPSDRHQTAGQFGDDLIKRWWHSRRIIVWILLATALMIGLAFASEWTRRGIKAAIDNNRLKGPKSWLSFDDLSYPMTNLGSAGDQIDIRRRGFPEFISLKGADETSPNFGGVARIGLPYSDERNDSGNQELALGFASLKYELMSGSAATISLWFKRASLKKIDTLLYLGESQGFGETKVPELTIWMDDNNRLRILSYRRYWDLPAKNPQLDYSIEVNETEAKWHHLAVVIDCGQLAPILGPGRFQVFLDGKEVLDHASVDLGFAIRNSKSELCYGSTFTQPERANRNFTGFFDDLKAWNRALSPAEILTEFLTKLGRNP